MGPSRIPDSGSSSVDEASAEMRGAALFKLIWDSVADVLGTTATAMLLRRAAQRAMARSPELGEFTVVRTDAGYTYTLPRALVGKLEHTPVALRELAAAIGLEQLRQHIRRNDRASIVDLDLDDVRRRREGSYLDRGGAAILDRVGDQIDQRLLDAVGVPGAGAVTKRLQHDRVRGIGAAALLHGVLA